MDSLVSATDVMEAPKVILPRSIVEAAYGTIRHDILNGTWRRERSCA